MRLPFAIAVTMLLCLVDGAPVPSKNAQAVIRLRNALKTTMVQAVDHIQAVAGSCPDNPETKPGSASASLYCNGERLNSLSKDLTSQSNEAIGLLDPVSNTMEAMGSSQSSMDKLDKLLTVADPALAMAAKIPYVGPVFNAAKTLMSPLKSAAGVLDDGLTKMDTAVVRPWEKSIGTTLEKLEEYTSKMSSVSPLVELFGSILATKCLAPLVAKLPGVSAIEATAKAAVGATSQLIDLISGLVKTLSGKAWKAIQAAMDKVSNAIGVVGKALDPLEPLTDLLTKKITLPWISTPYTRKDYGKPKCSTGYSLGTLKTKCWETCKQGYYSAASVTPSCKQYCDHVTKTKPGIDGCPNTNAYSREIKSRKTILKSCGDGYTAVAAKKECRKKCKSGEAMFGTAATAKKCYPNCPPPMVNRGADKMRCNVASYNKKSETANCKPYGPDISSNTVLGISGNCLQNCKSGELEIGKQCWKKAQLSFSISDIADQLQKVIDFITGLPIVKEIQSAIDTLVTKILKPVIDKLNFLPSAKDLPSLPKVSLDDLPLSGLADSLTKGISLPSVDDLTELTDKFTGVFTDALGKMKVDLPKLEALDCDDAACIAAAMGLPNIDLSSITEEVTSKMTDIEKSFKDAFGDGMGCQKWTTQKVDLLKGIKALGVSADESTDAGYDMPVCEELNLGASKLQELQASMLSIAEPAAAKLGDVLSGKDEAAAAELLQAGGILKPWEDQEWRYPFLALPLLIADLEKGLLNQDIRVKIYIDVAKTSTIGSMIRVVPEAQVWFYLKKAEGESKVKLQIMIKTKLSVKLLTQFGDPRRMAVQTLKTAQDVLLNVVNENKHCFDSDIWGHCEQKKEADKDACSTLCTKYNAMVDQANAPSGCTITDMVATVNSEEDQYFESDAGHKWASKCITYIDNQAYDVHRASKMLAWDSSAAGYWLSSNWENLKDMAGIPVLIPGSFISAVLDPDHKFLNEAHDYDTAFEPMWAVGLESSKLGNWENPVKLEFKFNIPSASIPMYLDWVSFGMLGIKNVVSTAKKHKSEWWEPFAVKKAYANRWGFYAMVGVQKVITVSDFQAIASDIGSAASAATNAVASAAANAVVPEGVTFHG